MQDDKKPKRFSRRNFVKGMSAAVAGTYVISGTTTKAAEKLSKEGESLKYKSLSFTLNGKKVKTDVKPNTTLLEVIRNEFGLTGTKLVCNRGECGGCTVVVNDKAIYSCHTLAIDVNDKNVLTIEGLEQNGDVHKVQKAFMEKDGLQCGFCTPGQIMTAYALLLNKPKPTKQQIKKAMSGNLCRCAAYPKIEEAVEHASKL